MSKKVTIAKLSEKIDSLKEKNDNDLIEDDDVWEAIQSFFQQNGLVACQIQSYNDFIYNRIHQIMENLKRITITEKDRFYSIEFGEILFMNPKFTETDDSTHDLYPTEALWRNCTYASEMYVDVTITPPTGEATFYDKVFIGMMPVMVGSDLCNLTGIKNNPEKLAKHNEDFYDQGGYFIIAPKGDNAPGSTAQRRVLIPQERSAPNLVYIFSNRKQKPRFSIYAEIKSSSSTGIHTTTAMVGLLNERFNVVLPWIDTEIPLGIVFKALGIVDEKDIAQLIIGPKYQEDKKMMEKLYLSLEYSFECKTQKDAFLFIGRKGRKFITSEEKVEKDEENEEMVEENEEEKIAEEAVEEEKIAEDAINYACHLLTHEFLPHIDQLKQSVESLFYTKAKFLAYMCRKTLLVALKRRNPEKRDHYMNKRILTTGILLGQQFYGAFRRLIMEVSNNTKKALRNGNNVNILSWIKSSIITNAMQGAIGGNNWSTGGPTAKGISQLYEQFNYAAGISNMRKLTVPITAEGGKIIDPRDLHGSHFGIVCPAETPEGRKCGLVKNLAMMSFITIGTDPVGVTNIIKKFVGEKEKENFPQSLEWTIVFVNGCPVGSTDKPNDLMKILLKTRRRGHISPETSIAHFDMHKEIQIATDAGRLARPLFIVEDGRLMFCPEDVLKLKREEMSWADLLISGKVELLDKAEEEMVFIAGFPSDLEKDPIKRMKYTHCEMHPSQMFGIGGSIIPFPDHNQSPRNTYQCIWKEEMVLMADKTLKKIKNIVVGDEICTFDPETLEVYTTKVIYHVVQRTDKKIIKLSSISGRTITVTYDHKLMTDRGWMEAGSIIPWKIKVAIFFGKAFFVEIATVEEVKNVEIADLTTESSFHSFIAGDGFMVHNSAMGKQAIGVPMSNYRQIMSGSMHTMQYIQKPLVLSRSASIIKFDQLPAGQNAIVAVMPRPFNEEDSIEMNQDSIDRGFMVSYRWTCYYADVRRERGEFFGIPKPETCEKYRGVNKYLSEEGFAKPGSVLRDGDIIIGKMVELQESTPDGKKYSNSSIIYDHQWPSTVDRVQLGTTGDGYRYIRVMLCQRMEPVVGDKFAARHGQKGTIGMKNRTADMPFSTKGIVPDIIMNSLALPSRMTIAMLIEILTGKVVCSTSPLHSMKLAEFGMGSGGMNADKNPDRSIVSSSDEFSSSLSSDFSKMFQHPANPECVDATPYRNFDIDVILKEMKNFAVDKSNVLPFSATEVNKEICELGYKCGDEMLIDGITGKRLRALIFEGPVFYQRLKHLVINKMHARARGGRTTLSRQPKEGRALGGGLRFGGMERDCMLGQGAARIVRDRLMVCSDEFKMWYCDICGIQALATLDESGEPEIKECKICGNNKISLIKIPYGSKLIIQEFASMNIVTRVLTTKPS